LSTDRYDEKSLGKGHNYLTIVYDLREATVEYIGDDRRKESLDGYFTGLTGTKYLWLYSRENVPSKKRRLFSMLRQLKLRTARACAIKESLRELWGYHRLGWALSHFRSWYGWAVRSRLEPVISVARMFRKYLGNILTYLRHRITNAVSEGLNSKIQTIKKMACGFRNRDHFKTAIYFHCGGLQLYPVTHRKV
jgi:transposase